jgi:hypothetical protein
MRTQVPGDPIWVIAALSQSTNEGDGVVTLVSEVVAVAKTREVAEDVLRLYRHPSGTEVVDLWIEESTLIDW